MGLSTEELKENISENAEGAIVDFLKRIQSIEDDEKLGLLSDMFGAEYADDVALLTVGLDNYTSAIGHLADKTKYAGSMNREFEVRSKTTANSMVLFKNGISEIGINIGSVLLPAFNSILKPLIGMTNSLAEATSEYPVLTKVVFGATFGVIGLGIAFSTLGFMGSFALSGLLIARKGLLLLTAALNFAKIGVRAFMGATGIGLLVVGASLIYEYWDPIKTFFTELWDNPMKKLNEFWDGLKDMFSFAKPMLMELGNIFGMVSDDELKVFKKEEAQKELDEAKKKSLPEIPKVNETTGVKTVNNSPTYHVTVNNPVDGFDIEKELKKVEQNNKNKQLEDLD